MNFYTDYTKPTNTYSIVRYNLKIRACVEILRIAVISGREIEGEERRGSRNKERANGQQHRPSPANPRLNPQ